MAGDCTAAVVAALMCGGLVVLLVVNLGRRDA